jgi:hypothetical protein
MKDWPKELSDVNNRMIIQDEVIHMSFLFKKFVELCFHAVHLSGMVWIVILYLCIVYTKLFFNNTEHCKIFTANKDLNLLVKLLWTKEL